jgi:hypothetical protein
MKITILQRLPILLPVEMAEEWFTLCLTEIFPEQELFWRMELQVVIHEIMVPLVLVKMGQAAVAVEDR